MIRLLTPQDTALLLDFAYKREKENLFIIGSFDKKRYTDPFMINRYFGYFTDGKLTGIGAHFGFWKSAAINADNAYKNIIFALTDAMVEAGLEIKYIPVFEKYGRVAVLRLKEKYNKIPHTIREETVMILTPENFRDFSLGDEMRGTPEYLDEIIQLEKIADRAPADTPITDAERKRVIPETEFLVKIDGKIVSKANTHGISKHYFQIGGVGTLPEFRGKGYAKRAVSALCRHFFKQSIQNALLFTDNTNEPAKRVYAALGFRPDDAFIIAQY